MRTNRLIKQAAVVVAGILGVASSQAVMVRINIENLAPANGTYLTPLWFGFHNGSFDIYDSGAPASAALERLAEDGNTGPISTDFAASAAGAAQGTILGLSGPIPPGETTSTVVMLDPLNPLNQYFSYASMVIPSNDAFIANGNPMAHQIFDGAGGFIGASFVVSSILDAGTEINDEIPANTAFLGQTTPNTGVDENGVVGPHSGFMPGGNILNDPLFANADFNAQGYQVARITISSVPDGGNTLALLAASFVLTGLAARRFPSLRAMTAR